MITVVCVKWGTLYGPEYVNRLRAMVARHLTSEHRFVCITESKRGLDPGIETIELPRGLTKWWGKLYAFKPGLFEDNTRVMLFDLDTVIVDKIDFIVPSISIMSGHAADLQIFPSIAALQGFGMPFRLGSAVVCWRTGLGYERIWTEYDKDRRFAHMFCGQWGDGHWMQLCVGPFVRLQERHPGKFVSYKWDCQDGIPEGAAVVCFHGHPRPHQVDDPAIVEHWCVDTADAA